MTLEEAEEIDAVRDDPRVWFHGFGYWRDEETRRARRGPANVLQRRVFEHYRRCQAEKKPCRMVVVKYRRAGSSTAGSGLVYMHAQNYTARLGVIGTDYRASHNMLEMVKFFGEHDDFPGWSVAMKAGGERKLTPEEWWGDELAVVPFAERVEKVIATRVEFAHDSTVELYTSKNPESARSAGLSGYHATECGRWATGGEMDAGETLTAMRNTLPKRGFHLALEESTANGAQGAFYETCRGARWPGYTDAEGPAAWWKQWEALWSLEESEFGRDLQFVLIFAAWFEDERHVSDPLTPAQVARLEETLDADEKALIERYGQEGPKGLRLGGEVQATVWEQLAWRRAIIENVCTKGGADEFKQEYPSDPREAFRSSGSPALDPEGVLALEAMCRGVEPEWGQLTLQQGSGMVSFDRCSEAEATVAVWEQPFEGGAYLESVDCMSGAEQITGTGVKDRHAPLVWRRAFMDDKGAFHRTRLVARIKHPCQWDESVLTQQVELLARYYGGPGGNTAMVAPEVEGGCGTALTKALLERGVNLYQRQEFDSATQKTSLKIGWRTNKTTRPVAIAELRKYVREQMVEVSCPHVVSELGSLIVDKAGKVCAASGCHDDNALSMAIGLTCIEQATIYPKRAAVRREAPDARRWR